MRPAGFGDKTGAKASEGQGCQRSPLRDTKRARVAEASRDRGPPGHQRDSKARKGAEREPRKRKRLQKWTPPEKPIRCRQTAEGSAVPLMSWGWLEGRKGAPRGRDGARPPRAICQGRTDTGTCAVGHVAHGRRHLELLEGGREGGDWVPLPPLLARVFLEVAVKRQQPYQCFGTFEWRQQVQASSLRNSG